MILITTKADRLELRAPFHPLLSPNARALGGRWRGSEVGWAVPVSQEEALRALCLRMWGVDGTPEASSDVVQLRIEVAERDIRFPIWRAHNDSIYLVGREIAASLKNRRGARPGRGVKFLAGGPKCQTEMNDYWTSIANGSVFLVNDTPRMAVNRFREALEGHGQMDVLAV
jgi:hypothetical protein